MKVNIRETSGSCICANRKKEKSETANERKTNKSVKGK